MIALAAFVGLSAGFFLAALFMMLLQPTESFVIKYSHYEKCYYVAYKEVNISPEPYFTTPLEARTWIENNYKDYVPPKTKFKIIE